MKIEVSEHDGINVAAIAGEIDSGTAPDAQTQLLPLIETGALLVLDMDQLTFLSSAGLRIMLLLYRQAAAHNGKVAMAGLSDTIKDTMQITGFLNFFLVCDSVDEALQAIKEG
jgi:anti-sigma B factor antagonist